MRRGRSEQTFDVLVVGGGSAGCAIAAGISEDPDCSVCVVEAGPDYGPYQDGRWPADMLDARCVPASHDWGMQAGNLKSARIIGGCSAHNGCLVAWGAPADYDDWAAVGSAGWSFAALEPYLRRAASRLRSRRLHEEEIGPWHQGVFQAAAQVGLPLLADFNDPESAEGIAFAPVNAVGAVRWNTAYSYLDPARGQESDGARLRARRSPPSPGRAGHYPVGCTNSAAYQIRSICRKIE